MEHNKNFYALHAVIFKKKNGWTLDKAEQEVNNYIKSSKKHFYRETSSSYRFRNIPKQKFISKTFRTKNLKNGISLVMGELKPEFHHLEGAGIFDLFKKPIKVVKQFFSPRQGFNNTTTKNLNAYGGMEIKRLTIARTPIMSILEKALGLITLGKWGSLKKEYGHDKLFHLALIANLGSKNLVVEKNEVINVNTSFKMSKDTETMDVDLKGKKFNVNQMLEATKRLMGEKNFYSYNSLTNNCQTFIKSCLMSMGLYDAEENNFVFQDLSELSKKVPSISKKIMNATTNLGAVVNKLTGQGEVKRKEITHMGINPLNGEGKMSLEDEFKMDEKDHEKKLSKLEASNPNKEVIKETLEGLRSITENGMKHIKKLEEMLELEGGSAKSAGFIKAIMARRKAEKEGRKTTRNDEFKNYEKSGFQEQKLNKSSQNLVTKVFKEGVYKKMVLNFAILNEYYLYNTKAIRELYNKDPENAKKAVEEIDEVLGDEKKVLEGLKKTLPNYDDLSEVEKNVYLINYKQVVRAKILAKYFDGLKPVVAETTDEMRERMKQNYIRWYNKNRKSKKPEKGKGYKELLENIENLEEGEELEIPTPTKGKKETIKKLEEEVKEAKKKRKSEFEPSEDRKAIDEALMDFMKKQENVKAKPKKKEADDFEDLLAESGLTMEDLNF